MSETAVIRGNHRQSLLDAAEEIVAEQGVGELTLEGVAARVGVTKGGLIYHFKTKEMLLHALVERMLEKIELRFRSVALRDGQTTAALLTALINDTFDMPDEEKKLLSNLLAAVSAYPNQLKPVQESYDRLSQDLMRSGKQAGLALAISCALDGLLYLELLKIKQFNQTEREQMRQALLEMVARELD